LKEWILISKKEPESLCQYFFLASNQAILVQQSGKECELLGDLIGILFLHVEES
jgi:hypothetical protein